LPARNSERFEDIGNHRLPARTLEKLAPATAIADRNAIRDRSRRKSCAQRGIYVVTPPADKWFNRTDRDESARGATGSGGSGPHDPANQANTHWER
jgi:hypothetical protein